MNYDNFEWDEEKHSINKEKHGIDFIEASTTFEDDDALILYDDTHSDDEERFIIIGFSEEERMLFVSHCYRDNDNIVRIISARKATRQEHKKYHSQY